MERVCDVAIVGGGPVGSALATAVSGSGLKTVVIEARGHAIGGDARTLALSYRSRLILDRLGAWNRIGSATEIRDIHVSQSGGFGRVVLSAAEAGMPALGYVVSHAQLLRALVETCVATDAILHSGSEVIDIQPEGECVKLGILRDRQRHELSARLLVIADGGANNGIRAGVRISVRDYPQHAVVGTVRTSTFHEYRAYERFTPSGPVALLPSGRDYALIWTAAPDTAEQLTGVSDAEFLVRLQRHFGNRAGQFLAVGPRSRFPLALRFARGTVLPRRVLLGNAAQALHPIAGQGFNLGLRDAWELGEAIIGRSDPDPGSASCLTAYRRGRRPDRLAGIALTHSLVEVFSNDFAPLRIARGVGLTLLGTLPAARRAFTRRMVFGAPL